MQADSGSTGISSANCFEWETCRSDLTVSTSSQCCCVVVSLSPQLYQSLVSRTVSSEGLILEQRAGYSMFLAG